MSDGREEPGGSEGAGSSLRRKRPRQVADEEKISEAIGRLIEVHSSMADGVRALMKKIDGDDDYDREVACYAIVNSLQRGDAIVDLLVANNLTIRLKNCISRVPIRAPVLSVLWNMIIIGGASVCERLVSEKWIDDHLWPALVDTTRDLHRALAIALGTQPADSTMAVPQFYVEILEQLFPLLELFATHSDACVSALSQPERFSALLALFADRTGTPTGVRELVGELLIVLCEDNDHLTQWSAPEQRMGWLHTLSETAIAAPISASAPADATAPIPLISQSVERLFVPSATAAAGTSTATVPSIDEHVRNHTLYLRVLAAHILIAMCADRLESVMGANDSIRSGIAILLTEALAIPVAGSFRILLQQTLNESTRVTEQAPSDDNDNDIDNDNDNDNDNDSRHNTSSAVPPTTSLAVAAPHPEYASAFIARGDLEGSSSSSTQNHWWRQWETQSRTFATAAECLTNVLVTGDSGGAAAGTKDDDDADAEMSESAEGGDLEFSAVIVGWLSQAGLLGSLIPALQSLMARIVPFSGGSVTASSSMAAVAPANADDPSSLASLGPSVTTCAATPNDAVSDALFLADPAVAEYKRIFRLSRVILLECINNLMLGFPWCGLTATPLHPDIPGSQFTSGVAAVAIPLVQSLPDVTTALLSAGLDHAFWSPTIRIVWTMHRRMASSPVASQFTPDAELVKSVMKSCRDIRAAGLRLELVGLLSSMGRFAHSTAQSWLYSSILLEMCVSDDAMVTAEALNGIFDIYANTEYDSVLKQVNAISKLSTLYTSLKKQKFPMWRKSLDSDDLCQVDEAISNLERFIDYKKSTM